MKDMSEEQVWSLAEKWPEIKGGLAETPLRDTMKSKKGDQSRSSPWPVASMAPEQYLHQFDLKTAQKILAVNIILVWPLFYLISDIFSGRIWWEGGWSQARDKRGEGGFSYFSFFHWPASIKFFGPFGFWPPTHPLISKESCRTEKSFCKIIVHDWMIF